MKVINPIWEYILKVIEKQIKDNKDKDYYLVLFTIYFALIDEGNITMSLNSKTLLDKWNHRLTSAKVLLQENGNYIEEEFQFVFNTSMHCINNYLVDINEDNLSNVIGNNKMFEIDNNYLYVKKYNVARKGIINSINRLFDNSNASLSNFDYKEYVDDSFRLSEGQEKAIVEGINNHQLFGGSLRGVINRIPYLVKLGVTGIYFTPIFLSPSAHKYDTTNYLLIDPQFGTNEDFKRFVEACHEADIKIVLDGVFNHTGIHFKPFEDVLKNGKAKAIKVSTLAKLCEALDCQPGDILEYQREQ